MNEELKKKQNPLEEEDIEALRADAMRYREHTKKKADFDKQVKQIQQGWAKDIEAMKKVVPGFDFAKAMENKEFYNLVMKGTSIPIAYLAVTAKMQKAEPQRRVIAQNAQSTSAQNGSPDQSVENMSDEDFARYIKRIKNR